MWSWRPCYFCQSCYKSLFVGAVKVHCTDPRCGASTWVWCLAGQRFPKISRDFPPQAEKSVTTFIIFYLFCPFLQHLTAHSMSWRIFIPFPLAIGKASPLGLVSLAGAKILILALQQLQGLCSCRVSLLLLFRIRGWICSLPISAVLLLFGKGSGVLPPPPGKVFGSFIKLPVNLEGLGGWIL